MIKKIIIFIGFLIFSIFIFISLIHPDDSRIFFDEANISKVKHRLTLRKSVEANDLLLTSTRNQYEYRTSIKDFALKTPFRVEILPFQKSNPYLIFLTTGTYPEKLVGRNSIAIFPGDEIEISPRLLGDFELRFSTLSLKEKALIKVYKNSDLIDRFISLLPEKTKNTDSFIYRNFSRFWTVDDKDFQYSPWTQQRIKLNINKSDKIKFKCQSVRGVCFITPPRIFHSRQTKKRNKILIIIDTLRHDGITHESMPFLSEYKETNYSFENMIATGNMTSPSTNGLLSCQRPSDIPNIAFSYGINEETRQKFHMRNQPSFPQLMLENGWNNAAIGNISVISSLYGIGVNHGFSEQISIERDGYDTAKIARSTMDWLDRNADQPFFLYTHLHAPHAPYRAPLKDIVETYRNIEDISSYSAALKWLYRAELHYTDRYIRKIFSRISKLGLTENTDIIISSDHGDQHTPHLFSENEANYELNGAFFDHGATLLNDEIKVPLIISSNQIPENGSNKIFVSNLDIGPTILNWSNLKTPSWCSGTSLKDIFLKNKIHRSVKQRIIGSEGFKKRAIIFQNRYKYIRSFGITHKKLYLPKKFSGRQYDLFESELLYDLKEDPLETKKLSHKRRTLLNNAKAIFTNYYDIKNIWNLVIILPKAGNLKIEFQEEILPINIKELDIKYKDRKTIIKHTSSNKLILKFNQPWVTSPKIIFNDTEVQLFKTSSKIKISHSLEEIPDEYPPKLELLGRTSKAIAYVIKSSNISDLNQDISTSNTQFDSVLREWGYLNDN